MLDVPPLVRNKALAVGAGAWLDELPALVGRLEQEWRLTLGPAYADGTEAFVAPVTLDDRTEAVLKLCVPRDLDAARHEATVLRLADGDGCVRLLHEDLSVGALLLERLGRSLHDLGMPFSRRLEVLCETSRRVWRPAAGCGLATGADKARWLAAEITRRWEALDHPCSAGAVDDALRCAKRRAAAHDDERAVLVHGDVHQWNALEDPDGGWKLIDPDGLLAEPEYDLGILMREDPTEGDLHERARWLATMTHLDATAIWDWGVVERVSTGLLATEIDLQPEGRDMLAAADRVAGTSV